MPWAFLAPWAHCWLCYKTHPTFSLCVEMRGGEEHCLLCVSESAAASLRKSSVLMALDVAKSLSEASLSQKAKCYRSWDCTDRQIDCLELASNVHQLLGAEEAKATLNDSESLAVSGRGGLATGVTATSRLPGMKANRLERRPLTYGADHSGDSSHCLGHLSFLEQQQVRGVC